MSAGVALPPAVAAWHDAGRFLNIGGRPVFLREDGRGPPLLLLHAYPTSSWGFHRIWGELTKDYRVLAPDLPGSGLSHKGPGEDYSLAGLGSVVTDLLAHCGVREPHLLAHGYGATIAQELLADGQDFASVCFVTASLFPEVSELTSMQRLMLSPLGPLLARYARQPFAVFARRLTRAFGPSHPPTSEELEAIWALLRHNDGQRAVPEVIGYLLERKRRARALVSAMLRADCPLHYIAAVDDTLSGQAVIDGWRRSLPDAGLVLLPSGTGHYAPLECPAELLSAYRDFRRAQA